MNTINDVKMVMFKENSLDMAKAVAINGNRDIPFEIKRVFYMYDSDTSVVRGQHANLRTEFVLINVKGESKIKVYDGTNSRIILLKEAMTGVYLPSMIWKDMYDFSKDSVLLVLASEGYDEKEYIRDLKEYDQMMKGHKKSCVFTHQ